MKSQQINSQINKGFSNTLLHGNCVELLTGIASGSADFVLTDPPYMVNYSSRDGRTVPNDDNDAWVKPAFREIYRVLRWNRFCVSFYSWNRADKLLAAWRKAGFRRAGHLTIIKKYASTERFLRYQHENAYLLAKGNPMKPGRSIASLDQPPPESQRARVNLQNRVAPSEQVRPKSGLSLPLATYLRCENRVHAMRHLAMAHKHWGLTRSRFLY